jgi:hypothetical protein
MNANLSKAGAQKYSARSLESQLHKRIKHPLTLAATIAIASVGHSEIVLAVQEASQLAGADKPVQAGTTSTRNQLKVLQEQNAELARQNTTLSQELARLRQRYVADNRLWAAQVEKAKKERVFLFSDSEENTRSQSALPVTSPAGDWFINFETYENEDKALERLGTIKKALVPIDISVSKGVVEGQVVYRIRSSGYASRAATNKAAKWINQRLSETSLWIGKRDEAARDQESLGTLDESARELRYVIFVADYPNKERANAVAQALTENGLVAEAKPFELETGTVHKVFIPDLVNKNDAEAILNSLQKTGSFSAAKILKSFSRLD